MSTPILANRTVRNPAFAGQIKPFTVGETQLVPSPRNDFVASDTLSLYCELGGLTDELKRSGSVSVTITRDDQVVASTVKALGNAGATYRILEEFPLANFPPAYYMASVALVDGAKAEVVSSRAAFFISPSQALPRSWILYSPLPPAGAPHFSNVLGMQYLQTGDLAKARTLLEEAFRKSPDSIPFALDFCRVLFAVKDYEGVIKVAMPFYKDKQKFEFGQFLGESSQALGRYAEAIGFYKDYLTSFGTNLSVLNSIGECYVRTGDLPGALTAWKKSLELNPAQNELKKKVAELEGKIKDRP
jgi:tetratricopeptide (TPR) repeat protein